MLCRAPPPAKIPLLRHDQIVGFMLEIALSSNLIVPQQIVTLAVSVVAAVAVVAVARFSPSVNAVWALFRIPLAVAPNNL